MKTPLKISIVTVCYNSEATIERTIRSVLEQSYDNIEYVIVDGMSTDGTIDIIDKYSDDIDVFIREKDEGVYDAMNKGLDGSSGDYILFLNADDRLFYENTISEAAGLITANESNPDVFLGDVVIHDQGKRKSSIWKSKKVTPYSLFRGSVPHPAAFYSRSAFSKNGMFDKSFRIAGDYEWFVRGTVNGSISFSRMNLLVSIFFKGGISTNPEFTRILQEEKNKIKMTHYSKMERIFYNFRYRIKKIIGI